MNIETFNSKRTELGVEGTGFTTTTTQERNWTDKTTGEFTFTIPTNSKVHVWFMPKTHPNNIFVQYGDSVMNASTSLAHRWLKGFKKPPTPETMRRWEWRSGMCKTVTGKNTEPDGYGCDGSPSWMLVCGII